MTLSINNHQKTTNNSAVSWISDESKQKIQVVFEPRYQRSLNDTEITEIAQNLTSFMEMMMSHKWSFYEKNNS